MITLTLRDIVNNRDWKLQTDAESLLIGRNRDAQVCIRDRSVSKNHCRIEKRGSSYRFKDLGSRNGPLINDLRCDSGPIENGDDSSLWFSHAVPASHSPFFRISSNKRGGDMGSSVMRTPVAR